MMEVLRYVLSMLFLTIYNSARVLLAAGREEEYRPGGVYDQVPRDYARALLRINRVSVRSEGLERLHGAGPRVYVVNHQSWFDVLAAVDVLPGSIRFLAKRALGRVPLFGPALRAAGHIEIDRHNHGAALAAYEIAARGLERGLSAVVFAEGTRSRDARLHPLKKGPFVLAILAQVPVVPVFVEGGNTILPKGSLHPRPGSMVVHVGYPIPTVGLTYEDRDNLSARARAALVALGARE